jgi:NDP-sugar pyrophosphorylase family protein
LVPVDADGRVTAFLEKPGPDEGAWVTDLINAGVYVLEPSVLEHVPAGRPSSFERDLFPSLLASGALVHGFELHGYWRDLGTPIAYLAAQFDLLEGRLHLPINAAERGRSQWFSDGAHVADGAVLRGPILIGQGARVEDEGRVFGPSVLGPGAVVAGGARLERSVLLEGARVERGAKVTDSIVGTGVVVGDGAVVRDGAVVGDNVMIEAGNVLAAGVRVAPNVRLGLGAIRF